MLLLLLSFLGRVVKEKKETTKQNEDKKKTKQKRIVGLKSPTHSSIMASDTAAYCSFPFYLELFLSFFFFSPSTSSTSRRCRRRRRRDVIETEKKSKEINIKRTSFFLKSFLAIDRYDRLSIDIEAHRRRCRRRRRRDVIETEKKWKKSTTKNNRS